MFKTLNTKRTNNANNEYGNQLSRQVSKEALIANT
jgi:hypothetical protein